MTIAHLSDTHLGFRAYGKVRPDGANVREADVLETFEAALDAIAARDPDLVIHAGDLFHVVRPSNLSLVGGYRAVDAFQRRREGRPFVILGGNHDVPRAGTGGLLPLFAGIPGVRVVERQVETLDLGFVRVVAVPSVALKAGGLALEPPEGPAVLTLHGMSRQALPKGREGGDFDAEALRHAGWDYVALGDYHVFQAYGENVCYAGSTDFASTNVWEESRHAKGWVWFDGRIEFVPVATRPVLDLPSIDARGWTTKRWRRGWWRRSTRRWPLLLPFSFATHKGNAWAPPPPRSSLSFLKGNHFGGPSCGSGSWTPRRGCGRGSPRWWCGISRAGPVVRGGGDDGGARGGAGGRRDDPGGRVAGAPAGGAGARGARARGDGGERARVAAEAAEGEA